MLELRAAGARPTYVSPSQHRTRARLRTALHALPEAWALLRRLPATSPHPSGSRRSSDLRVRAMTDHNDDDSDPTPIEPAVMRRQSGQHGLGLSDCPVCAKDPRPLVLCALCLGARRVPLSVATAWLLDQGRALEEPTWTCHRRRGRSCALPQRRRSDSEHSRRPAHRPLPPVIDRHLPANGCHHGIGRLRSVSEPIRSGPAHLDAGRSDRKPHQKPGCDAATSRISIEIVPFSNGCDSLHP
ncbi:MAG: hypothetical protein ACYCPT_02120 [Acidimicrobiales bacterium]